MASYLILFLCIVLGNIVLLVNEVEDDVKSIKAGYGDNHSKDVFIYILYSFVLGIVASVLGETLGGFIAVPLYLIMRFSLFNKFINKDLGNEWWYLSNRGFDRYYGAIVNNRYVRRAIEISALAFSPLYLRPLFQWLDSISLFVA